MDDVRDIVLKKAAKIVAGQPVYATSSDVRTALIRRFRLNKKEAELLMKRV